MMLRPFATTAEANFGPALTARWPAALFGAVGVVWLCWQSVIARRQGHRQPRTLVALGLAWFGLGVGVLVVLARSRFFQQYADQIVAQRYVPWSMLMWTGLLLTLVASARHSVRMKVLVILSAAMLFAPSQVWTGRYAFHRQTAANYTAIAAAVEVVDVDFELIETLKTDLLRAMPLLRDAKKSVWSWPTVQLLGKAAPAKATAVATHNVRVRPVRNLFARPGSEVQFAADAPVDLLLLIDAQGVVQGLAMPTESEGIWIGWLRGLATAADIRVVY